MLVQKRFAMLVEKKICDACKKNCIACALQIGKLHLTLKMNALSKSPSAWSKFVMSSCRLSIFRDIDRVFQIARLTNTKNNKDSK